MFKLSNTTTQLLSSGQVITCASNVVKELVENALDAFADVIEIKLEKGGVAKVEVRDNGVGIKACDVQVAAQRHYTSKISSHSDLQRLSTYGFRGEALNSICQFADVTITTRTKEEPYSLVYTLNSNGTVKSKKPSHISHGTTVAVMNLFKNLPVRKQFFGSAKKVREQLKAIEMLLMTFAISYPQAQFKLINDRCIIWQKIKCLDEKKAFLQVLSLTESQILASSISCASTNTRIKIYFPKTYAHRKSLDRFFLIINKRPIRNKQIEKLVRSFILKITGENEHLTGWPTVCLIIDVSSSLVDVNVNPSKTAVHLSCNDVIIELLQNLLESLLAESTQNQPRSSCVNTTSNEVDQLCNVIEEKQNGINHQDNSIPNQEFSNLGESKKNDFVEMQVSRSINHAPTEKQSNSLTIDENIHKTTNTSSLSKHISGSSITTRPLTETTAVKDTAVDACEKELILNGNVDDMQQSNRKKSNVHQCSPEHSCDEVGSKNWSCGNAVTAQNGETIEPVKVIRPLSTCTNLKQKRPFNSPELKQATLDDIAVPSNAKRPRSIFEVIKDTGIDKDWDKLSEKEQDAAISTACKEYDNFSKVTIKAKQKRERKSFVSLHKQSDSNEDECSKPQEVMLPIDFTKLSQRIEKLSLEFQPKELVKVVGYLNNYNAAVVKYSSKYYLVNLTRLQECLVYQKLLQDFKLPSVELDTSIELTENSIGAEAFNMLQNLPFSPPSVLHPDGEILDELISSNGFKIKRICSSSPSFQISSLATNIPCYGVMDLKEILLKISRNVNLTLAESRPTKCVYYLQSEASRIAQSSPVLRCKIELLDVISSLNKSGSWTETLTQSSCFHSKNIFYSLSLT